MDLVVEGVSRECRHTARPGGTARPGWRRIPAGGRRWRFLCCSRVIFDIFSLFREVGSCSTGVPLFNLRPARGRTLSVRRVSGVHADAYGTAPGAKVSMNGTSRQRYPRPWGACGDGGAMIDVSRFYKLNRFVAPRWRSNPRSSQSRRAVRQAIPGFRVWIQGGPGMVRFRRDLGKTFGSRMRAEVARFRPSPADLPQRSFPRARPRSFSC